MVHMLVILLRLLIRVLAHAQTLQRREIRKGIHRPEPLGAHQDEPNEQEMKILAPQDGKKELAEDVFAEFIAGWLLQGAPSAVVSSFS